MPDPTPVAASGAPAGTVEPSSGSGGTAVSRREVSEFVQSMIARYGSTANALERLGGEQLKYRKRAQRAEKERDTLKARVPAADAVVLTADEAKAYNELKKSGHTLDKVPGMLTELSTLKTKDSSMSRESALKLASGEGETAKYKSKVLGRLLKDDNGKDIPLEFKKVMVKGKDAEGKPTMTEEQVAYVVIGEGATQTRELLDTYLEREHEEFMDVLVISEEEPGNAGSARSETKEKPAAKTGVQAIPGQRAAPRSTPKDEGKQVKDAVDKQLGGKYLSPSQRAKAGAAGNAG